MVFFMEVNMEYVIGFGIIFIISLIILLLFSYLIPLKRQRLERNKAIQYIVKKNSLSHDGKTIRKLGIILVFLHAFLIAIPGTLFIFVDLNITWIGLISLGFFVGALLGSYELLGMILKKKGW